MEHELFGLTALHAWGPRERMIWQHSRGGDLSRLLGGVQEAMGRVIEGRGDLDELDKAIALLRNRADWIRGELAALETLRAKEKEKRSS